MGFTLADALALLPKVGAAVAALPEFKKVYDQAVSVLHSDDQAKAKQGYQAIIAENAAGHAELQQLLAEAAKR